ncbi:MAG: FKBP-type peptidyl-prolyl cis-trans isomerase [Dyadobacter sp.]|uniref:FKBP-type peptidyl-prolyl cis-trans isomerase n=1 Tax=Dyadobacter sp. TaxID=1914288 RepID=UPI001B260633|nr:FKBP-type peptidyl-prolyl cis-trans isomerase [Dyadobacter sp.]MBO9617176.1 FKBP-type peptidyl-prolyl cis-trans isomerase [Dyadobacter sp.]
MRINSSKLNFLTALKKARFFVLAFLLVSCISTKMQQSASGLQYTILKKGNGPKAKIGQEVLLFETTSYRTGQVLYSNENTTTPVKVLIGGNQATKAVDEALMGMQEGEIKQIIAPPYLVKRKEYPSNVHPDSALVIKMILHKIL